MRASDESGQASKERQAQRTLLAMSRDRGCMVSHRATAEAHNEEQSTCKKHEGQSMRNNIAFYVFTIALVTFGANESVFADLYGESGGFLYGIEKANGATTLIGPGSIAITGGIAFDPSTDNLYGESGGFSFGIDKSDGATSLIGPGSIAITGGIAFDPSTDNLYGESGGFSFGIDKSDGATSLIGPGSIAITGGIAFDPSTDNLYGESGGFSFGIDKSDGATSLIGPGSIAITGGIAFDPSTDNLYGESGGFLYTIDKANGATTLIGPGSIAITGGIAFAPLAVPEPSSLVLLTSGAIGLIGYKWCRTQKATRELHSGQDVTESPVILFMPFRSTESKRRAA